MRGKSGKICTRNGKKSSKRYIRKGKKKKEQNKSKKVRGIEGGIW